MESDALEDIWRFACFFKDFVVPLWLLWNQKFQLLYNKLHYAKTVCVLGTYVSA